MPDADPRPGNDGFRWWALGASAILCASLLGYALRYGPAALPALAGMGLSVFFSKLLIFQGAIAGHPFSPWSLALISWELDLLASVLILTWVARIERLPAAGPALVRARKRAEESLLTYPALRRMALTGITLFVFVPLPGSGSVTGTLIGRMAGLSRRGCFLAVSTGAGVAVVAYAGAAVFLGEQWSSLLQSPLVLIASFLCLVAFGWFAWRYVRRILLKA